MKKKILLIDDDKLILKTIQRVLEKHEYEVHSASDSALALTLAETVNFDLIISDVRMPREDGLSLLKKIKESAQRRDAKHVPFIFITGYANEDAPEQAVRLGADGYILKPLDLDQFLITIQIALSKER